ncbi:MAG: hypothetical protein IPO91_34255 [Chloroflexi bacterium]|nr:hypothetical protein [Chloroflexota bacterium]
MSSRAHHRHAAAGGHGWSRADGGQRAARGHQVGGEQRQWGALALIVLGDEKTQEHGRRYICQGHGERGI